MSSNERWRKRFTSFKKAMGRLSEAVENGADELTTLEKEGVIQRFEFTIELAWKTVKDFLESQGLVIDPLLPRQVMKEAFSAGVVTDGQVWIDMLGHRNLLSHTYNETLLETVIEAISNRYLAAFKELEAYFSTREGA